MNLKRKFQYLNVLIFFQAILDLSFFIIIKEQQGEDCLNLFIYLIIDAILKTLCLFFPLFVLSNGLQIKQFYILGNITQFVLFLSNLTYPFLLIINYSLPKQKGVECQNNSPTLIIQTSVSLISTLLYFLILKNTLKKEYHIIKECVVCLENIDSNENEIKLSCDHIYHKDCILEWGIKHTKCPICRKDFNIFIE